MVRFECDYGEGAAQPVLDLLLKTNLEQTPGYGEDIYCDRARARIRALCESPQAGIHFFVGATQANLTVIDAALKPWQGVLCADSGHIHVHETGAVEATGHKCLVLPGKDGKITAAQIENAVAAHHANLTHEHEVQPGMVYLSNPTEWGTLYSKAELTEISRVCRTAGIYLFVDGARMAYGLASAANDLTLPDYAALCDAFYLGGTKCGALFGEALVLTNPALDKDFRYALKQHGGMLAKGRLLGLQFLGLLGEEVPLTRNALLPACCAGRRAGQTHRRRLRRQGLRDAVFLPTNQQFPVLPLAWADQLGKKYSFSPSGKVGENRCAVRFCTSWATKQADVEALVADIAAL